MECFEYACMAILCIALFAAVVGLIAMMIRIFKK